MPSRVSEMATTLGVSGEPMMQAAFVAAIFQEAHVLGVNTVIDTAGWGNQDDYATVLPHTDRVMLCVKAMDPAR